MLFTYELSRDLSTSRDMPLAYEIDLNISALLRLRAEGASLKFDGVLHVILISHIGAKPLERRAPQRCPAETLFIFFGAETTPAFGIKLKYRLPRREVGNLCRPLFARMGTRFPTGVAAESYSRRAEVDVRRTFAHRSFDGEI